MNTINFLISDALQQARLGYEKQAFNVDKKKLNKLLFSLFFSIIAFLPAIFMQFSQKGMKEYFMDFWKTYLLSTCHELGSENVKFWASHATTS